MQKLNPKAVIFDLGCTLIEYEALSWDELAKDAVRNAYDSLRKLKLEVGDYESFMEQYTAIRDEYRKRAKSTLVEWQVTDVARDLLEKLGANSDEKLIETFWEAYYEPVAEQLYVYSDVVETLTWLRERCAVIGLISNTIFPDYAHRAELDRFGISHFFDFDLYSSQFGMRKPHEDIFYQAANMAGYAPGECLYIGDRYVEDIQGPTAIGMDAILKVREGREYPEEMPEAYARINSLAELRELFEN